MKDWRQTKWTLEDGTTIDIKEVLYRCRDYPVVDLLLEDIERIRTVEIIDQERVDNASLLYPILIVEEESRRYILDGNHRLQKAINENKSTIKAKILRGII